MFQQKDISVENKLRLLYDLQIVNSFVDEVDSIMSDIPLQLKAIEYEVENIQKKYKKIGEEIKEYDDSIQKEKNIIKENEIFIKKYTHKQYKIYGNTELEDEALNKEIEFKELEIELCHKKWKKIRSKKNKKNNFYMNFASIYDIKKDYLLNKKKEFDKVLIKQGKKKNNLLKISYILSKRIEPQLLQLYNRIRSRSKLAIVPIIKKAPVGSFFIIPTQYTLDVVQRNRIIIDEHSGRILIDPVLAEEEYNKIFAFYRTL